MKTEPVIYELVSSDARHRHPVRFWPGYGAVCPTLWTTNGSLGYVARLTSEYVASGRYGVEGSTLEPSLDFKNPEAIRDALKVAWDKFSVEKG